MSGHSKWANIKRKKEVTDKARGAVFAKLSRLITLAVVEGGHEGNPAHNFKLRLTIDKARSANMPKENIQRAIEKGTGSDKHFLKEVIYEGFAPHGVAILIHATTDNPNRTVSEIKNCFEQHGGKLGSQHSVAYLFQHCAKVAFDLVGNKEEDVFEFAQSLKALDFDEDETSYYAYIPFELFGRIKEHLEKVKPRSTEIFFKPQTIISLTKEEEVKQVLGLIEALEELDDVHEVFSNLEL